jgi:hypothetical protein
VSGRTPFIELHSQAIPSRPTNIGDHGHRDRRSGIGQITAGAGRASCHVAGAQTRPLRFLRHGMLPLPRVLGGGRIAEEIAEFEVDVGAVVAPVGS